MKTGQRKGGRKDEERLRMRMRDLGAEGGEERRWWKNGKLGRYRV
jgi:hypothetical protein